ncbi:MAG: hypothetical protein GEU92_17015 [Alphaproteobacteria bacterium]|nr:hypothetical protein [Alphaproteobacteria bacterium]
MDDAIFSEALRQEYPTVRFVGHSRWRGETPIYGSVPEGRHSRITAIIVPPEGWAPDVRTTGEDGYRYFPDWPRLMLNFDPSVWDWSPEFYPRRWAWDPPTLSAGFITGTIRRDDPEEEPLRALIRKTWRIIGRIATNRLKGGHPRGNELMGGDKALMEDAKGGPLWAGHHALEWCSAAPRRMLDGRLRPRDDWAPPHNDRYRGLREDVLAKYGPALGETPTER